MKRLTDFPLHLMVLLHTAFLGVACLLVALNWRGITEEHVAFRVMKIEPGLRVNVIGTAGCETLAFDDPFAWRKFNRDPLPDLLQVGKVYSARVYGLGWYNRRIISVEEL